MSAILKFDFQKREQLRFSEVNYLNYTKKDPILHEATTFSLKQGETRTSHGPILHPLSFEYWYPTIFLLGRVEYSKQMLKQASTSRFPPEIKEFKMENRVSFWPCGTAVMLTVTYGVELLYLRICANLRKVSLPLILACII